jgi:hypothetical protein
MISCMGAVGVVCQYYNECEQFSKHDLLAKLRAPQILVLSTISAAKSTTLTSASEPGDLAAISDNAAISSSSTKFTPTAPLSHSVSSAQLERLHNQPVALASLADELDSCSHDVDEVDGRAEIRCDVYDMRMVHPRPVSTPENGGEGGAGGSAGAAAEIAGAGSVFVSLAIGHHSTQHSPRFQRAPLGVASL